MSAIKYLLLIMLGLLPSFTFAESPWQVKMQNFLDGWRVQNKIPAAVISVQLSDGKIYNFFSGTTKFAGKTSLQEKKLFAAGSITKTFVAARILQLQEKHQLNLEDKLSLYFPEYPRWSNITIRQLLNMTSGIANFTRTEKFKKLIANEPEAYHPMSYFVGLAYEQPDQFKPGDSWFYSNTNYYLLGMLIEKITDRKLADDFKQSFFIPLNLKNSYYSESVYSKKINALRISGYLNNKDVTDENPAYYGPAGSMLMSSKDIIIWVKALFTPGKVLSEASLTEMKKTIKMPPSPPKPKAAYGLGVYSLVLPKEGLVWWYTGVVNGYSSVFIYIPKKQIIIAAQIDRWSGDEFGLLFPQQKFMDKILMILNVE